MRLSYKWLQEYVDLSDITPQQLADKLTTAGLEVEGIEPMAQGTGLVIAEVIECEDIPDTHLHRTIVRYGAGENDTTQIVCGAANCRLGLKVIAALPGAVLPGITIQAKPLHGIESNGMLCSLRELGIDHKYLTEKQINGIEELPEDAPVGETNVLGYIGYDDTILDVSLTPNRADCSSMWNMAKEVGAILHREVKWPDYAGKSNIGTPSTFKVTSNTEKCDFFMGKVVNHVKVGPSSKWMVEYLHAAGINSINNVVDISNFVMLETGQPLHYYNLAKLPTREITVVDDRTLKMTALDGVEFAIEKGDILITTNGEVTGIAGIMGGEESMIDETTEGIFIEAAHFNKTSVRRSSIRLNLITEAAQRFTKGIEALAAQKAMDRSVQLLQEYACADGFEETVTYGTDGYKPVVVKETLSHCNALLGTAFTMDEVKETLTWLNFEPEVNGDEITCHIPSYRVDIEGRADIDEEIVRLIGFDTLKSTLPVMSTTVGQLSPKQKLRRMTRETLKAFGLIEIVTYTLISEEEMKTALSPLGEAIPLAMPMSENRKYIRASLLNSVLTSVQYNEAHQNTDNLLFEISKVYAKDKEEERLAVVLDGNVQNDPLHKLNEAGDFYALKGILMTWLNRCGFNDARITVRPNTTDVEHFHPYRSAEILLDRKPLGLFGELHPSYAKKYDLKRVTYAELSLDVVNETSASKVKFVPIDRYPSISRDIALVVDREVTAEEMLKIINSTGKKLVRKSEVFDIYEGEHVEAGKKSVALRITYQASDHTLNDEEVRAVHDAILEKLKEKLSADLRS